MGGNREQKVKERRCEPNPIIATGRKGGRQCGARRQWLTDVEYTTTDLVQHQVGWMPIAQAQYVTDH